MLNIRMMLLLSILLLLNEPVAAQNKKFYFKTIAALNKNSNIKTIESDINFILNQKANLSPTLGIGIGYYINSFFRVDLILEKTNINFATKSGAFNFSDNGIFHYGTRSIKRTATIQSIMFNGYIDILNKSSFKVFLGSGIGIGSSRIKEKSFDRFDNNIVVNGNIINLPPIFSSSTNKNRNTLSYAFMVGTDLNICKNFNIELAYSWKHAGKVKVEDQINNTYQGHNISVAARFDL